LKTFVDPLNFTKKGAVNRGVSIRPDRENSPEKDDFMTEKDPIKVKINTDDSEMPEAVNQEGEATESAPEEETPQTPEEKLEQAQAEAAEAHDRFLRASAELENYKKRTQKEMAEFKRFANASLVKEILGVVDNLERAVESSNGTNDKEQLAQGLDLTLKELLKIFKTFHVTPVESLGEKFDPRYHQAMMQEETTDHPGNVVIKELQKGYMIHDRLLRPAMVVVSKAAPDAQEDPQSDDSE
jgi:molecular chaperone GrpE